MFSQFCQYENLKSRIGKSVKCDRVNEGDGNFKRKQLCQVIKPAVRSILSISLLSLSNRDRGTWEARRSVPKFNPQQIQILNEKLDCVLEKLIEAVVNSESIRDRQPEQSA